MLLDLQVINQTVNIFIGKTFITGIAMRYDPQYKNDHKLLQKLSKEEFSYLIGHLNETISAYWPCLFTIYIAYILAPFTFGLSFYLPNLCIGDAKTNLLESIER